MNIQQIKYGYHIYYYVDIYSSAKSFCNYEKDYPNEAKFGTSNIESYNRYVKRYIKRCLEGRPYRDEPCTKCYWVYNQKRVNNVSG